MFTVEEICEEQERQYNQLMQEDDQYCHPESFKWGFEHGVEYALTKLGWHPASELPEEGSECVVYLENTKVYKYIFSKTSIYNGEWYYCGLHDEPQRIVGWCYPPDED